MRDIEDVAAVLAVADHGGFGRAATTLGVSKSVVSRRVARLETALGVRLLARTTRGVSLTEAGAEYTSRARALLDGFDALATDLAHADGQVTGTLRIAAPLSFGTLHLAPVLAAFALLHPRLTLDVAYSDRLADLVADRFDLAVRIGTLADSTLVARRLAPMRGVVAASPGYIAARGSPATPADLARHDCIVYSGMPDGDLWRFRVGNRWQAVRVAGRVRTDNGEAMREAAVAGLGICALPTFLMGETLGSGTLTPVLTGFALPERALHVVRPPGPAPAKVRVLTDFLAERFGPEPYWDPCWGKAG